MANDIASGIKNLSAALKSIKGEIKDTFAEIKHGAPELKAMIADFNKVATKTGQRSIGRGNKVSLGTDDANVPTAPGGTGLEGSLASSQTMVNYYRMTGMTPGMAKANIMGGAAQMALAPIAGAYSAMPDLGTTVSRAAGYYGASVQFGGSSMKALQTGTLKALGGSITGLGEDAAAAAQLVQGYNYMPGSSAYLQSMKEVGGAARALNMSNATAASAIGGFQTGPMGANLYQYGIAQFDKKGNPLSQAAIARQLYNRIFTNQKGLTTKDVQMSMQYGLAGADLRTMGFSAEQQQLLQYQFGQFAAGKNGDLSKAAGAGNPMSAAYNMNASQTDLIQRGQDAMIQGFSDAATAVGKMNKAMEGLPDQFFKLKGILQGMTGSNVGSGIATTLGGLASGAMNIGMGALALRGMGMSKAGVAGAIGTAGKKVLTPLAAAAAGNIAGGLVKGNSAKGSARSRAGNAMKWAGNIAAGASFLNFIPGVDFGVWGAAALGGLYGAATGGGSTGFGASFGAKGGGTTGPSAVQSPIPGVSVTTGYGAKGDIWGKSNNTHKGQDYAVPVGTPVEAVMAGMVIDENLSTDYGVYVQIDHGNGYQTIYGHLSSKSVSRGDSVKAGQVIGKSGATGNVDGPHLHFEVRKGKNNPVDPSQLLGGGSVLSSNVSGGAQVTKGTVLGTGSQQAWAKNLLQKLGDPVSKQNVTALTTWAAYEGGHWNNTANYNPLNTTQPASGATNMNKVGVKSYKSWDQGFQATIDTLNNGRYSNILSALAKGNDTNAVLTAVNKSPWGTHIPSAKGGGSSGYGASLPGGSAPVVHNTFNMPITVERASEQEAIQLAKKVQTMIEEKSNIKMSGKY